MIRLTYRFRTADGHEGSARTSSPEGADALLATACRDLERGIEPISIESGTNVLFDAGMIRATAAQRGLTLSPAPYPIRLVA